MKGVVLAGGLGTRLHPLTKVTNKHLLPVYGKPMVFYPIESLVQAGIEDIMIVTGGNNANPNGANDGGGNLHGIANNPGKSGTNPNDDGTAGFANQLETVHGGIGDVNKNAD